MVIPCEVSFFSFKKRGIFCRTIVFFGVSLDFFLLMAQIRPTCGGIQLFNLLGISFDQEVVQIQISI